jgi:hypothetical protein
VALSTYTELQASVADWLNRTDLTARLPDFVKLCEAEISRQVRRTTTREALSLDSGEVTLPTTLSELRSIRLNGSLGTQQGNIDVVTPETLADYRRTHTAAGQPRWASVVGRELLLVPEPDQTYTSEIVYYAKLLPLATNSVNAELTEAPDLYLYGTLIEAAAFLEHDERLPTWQSRFDKAVRGLNVKREQEEYGASIRPVRLPVRF